MTMSNIQLGNMRPGSDLMFLLFKISHDVQLQSRLARELN